MREIKFRGKRKDLINNEWYYGFLNIEPNSSHWIDYFIDGKRRTVEVIKESVGQYAGLKTKNCTELYEGDVVHILGGEEHQGYRELNEIGTITYGLSASFDVVNNEKVHYSFGYCPIDEITVIGNIHESPELLNKK